VCSWNISVERSSFQITVRQRASMKLLKICQGKFPFQFISLFGGHLFWFSINFARKFPYHLPSFGKLWSFLVEWKASLIKWDRYWLPFTRKFRKFWSECKWLDKVDSTSRKIFRKSRNILNGRSKNSTPEYPSGKCVYQFAILHRHLGIMMRSNSCFFGKLVLFLSKW